MFLSQCIAHSVDFQNIHTYQKNTSCTFLLVFKIIEYIQCILKVINGFFNQQISQHFQIWSKIAYLASKT